MGTDYGPWSLVWSRPSESDLDLFWICSCENKITCVISRGLGVSGLGLV